MRQTNFIKLLAIRSLMVIVLGTMLFSFTERAGGDSFTIHLNNKLLMKEYVMPDRTVKKLALNVSDGDDLLKLQYSHCGKIGSGRSIAIVDGEERILKSWRFVDHSSIMDVKVSELFTVKRKATENLRLLYSSHELPKGIVLAELGFSNESKASLR